jgi:hypothetical protein
MTDLLPILNVALNLLIIPILKILWDIKNGLARLESTVQSQGSRLDRIERQQDKA